MVATPFDAIPKQGVVAVNSPSYVRQMLTNLHDGVVSVLLRQADDRERMDRANVTDVVVPKADAGWLQMAFASPDSDGLAQISFTSGTEGAAKAVYLSQSNLHDVVTRLSNVMALDEGIREYIGVPVYHSFGYGRARSILNAGGECYIPPDGFDLMEIRRMLRAGEINAISAVPSLWHMFLQSRDLFGSELENVRWVEIGSQYMSAHDKNALRQVLPNARIVQHYGLTEASRTTFQRIDTAAQDALPSVGSATGSVALRLSDQNVIEIKGDHVALGVDDGTSFQAFEKGAWFQTSDLGQLKDGQLYFQGRADDVINISGIKLVPDLIEAYMRQTVSDVGDFGVLRRSDQMRGEGILLVVTPETAVQSQTLVDAIDTYAKSQGVNARAAIATQTLPSLPRTATGKLQRKTIDVTQPAPVPPKAKPEGLAEQIKYSLGPEALQDMQSSFYELGGDSLAHMQIGLAIERAFGGPMDSWESLPLADLVAQADAWPASDVSAAGTPALPDGKENMNPTDLRFWQLVREDFRTNDASLVHQGFLMLFVHRFGNWRMGVKTKILRAPLTVIYRILNKLTQLLFGMKLDYTVKVGRRVKLEHFGGMILGAREIGDDVVLRQNTTLGIRTTADTRAKPILGNRVDVGAGAVIVGNIRIGDNSIIGANSVVFGNIPENAIVMGVPAKIIGQNPRQNPSPLKDADRH